MLGNEWQKYFDIVIIQARKPDFFAMKNNSAFRVYSPKNDRLKWKRVEKLEPNTIYSGGTIFELERLTGWDGERVLYFGDHVYTDLADLSMNHLWRTGAVIQVR